MNEEELIELVARIRECKASSEDELMDWINQLKSKVPDPEVMRLLGQQQLSAKEVIESAFTFKPIIPPFDPNWG